MKKRRFTKKFIKTRLSKINSNWIEARSYERDLCRKRGWNMKLEYQGKSITIPFEELDSAAVNEDKENLHPSKYGTAPYYLVAYVWPHDKN